MERKSPSYELVQIYDSSEGGNPHDILGDNVGEYLIAVCGPPPALKSNQSVGIAGYFSGAAIQDTGCHFTGIFANLNGVEEESPNEIYEHIHNTGIKNVGMRTSYPNIDVIYRRNRHNIPKSIE